MGRGVSVTEPFTVHSVPPSGPEARADVLGITNWFFQRRDTTSDLKSESLALTLAWLLTEGRCTHKYVAVGDNPISPFPVLQGSGEA